MAIFQQAVNYIVKDRQWQVIGKIKIGQGSLYTMKTQVPL